MKFGNQSENCLKTCHPDLVLIHRTAIKYIAIDYAIHEGARSFDDQLKYFLSGKSKLDPRNEAMLAAAKHVTGLGRKLSEATDIHICGSYQGKALTWDKDHLIYVVGYLTAIADMLFEQGKITHKLRSGINWDRDGVILLDQSFDDFPHVELYIP